MAPSSSSDRPRQYWLDWLRTQSVWNVVCGHILWYAKDVTGLSSSPSENASQFFGGRWNEVLRMMEYTIHQGMLHTIPVFFLIAGVLTSYTLRADATGIKRFLCNRSVRILPPLACGIALELLFRNVAPTEGRDDGTPIAALTSTLWFLWVYMLAQICCLPFFVACRTLLDTETEPTPKGKIAISIALHALVSMALGLALGIAFDLGGSSKAGWVVAITVPPSAALAFYAMARTAASPRVSDALCVVGTALVPTLSFAFLSAHDVCPVPECGQFDFFSVNLVLAVVVVLACQYCGFVFAEARDRLSRLLSGTPVHALAVVALLLSMYWPYFTYWGPSYYRRNVWMGVYQATTPGPCPTTEQVLATNITQRWAVWDDPASPCVGPCNADGPCRVRPAPPSGLDPDVQGGTGPAWGMARGAFWGAVMILFAKAYCNHAVHPFLHRHLTQSGIVLYLLHPIVYPYITVALRNAGLGESTAALYHLSTPLVFLACFALYAIINSNPWTAAAFGVIPANFERRPLTCGKARGKATASVQRTEHPV